MWLSEALASPQARRGREGRCRGSQPGARSSLDGAAASPLQLPVACLSYFKKSKVPDNREGLFWMWSLDSMECYITSVVTQPCKSSSKTARPRNTNDSKIAVVLGLVLGYHLSPGSRSTFQEATTGTDLTLNLFEAPLCLLLLLIFILSFFHFVSYFLSFNLDLVLPPFLFTHHHSIFLCIKLDFQTFVFLLKKR